MPRARRMRRYDGRRIGPWGVGAFGGGSAPAAWTPASLAGLAPSIQVALSRSLGLIWKNAAKDDPATEDGDAVRVITCPWTGQDYTAPSDSARPLLWDEGGGLWSLAFDGIDDIVAASFTLGAPYTLCYAGQYTALSNGVVSSGGSADKADVFRGSGVMRMFNGSLLITSYSLSVNVGYVSRWNHTGAAVRAYVGGASVMSATANTSPALGGVGVGGINGTGGFFTAIRVAGFVPATADTTGDDATNLDTYMAALLP